MPAARTQIELARKFGATARKVPENSLSVGYVYLDSKLVEFLLMISM